MIGENDERTHLVQWHAKAGKVFQTDFRETPDAEDAVDISHTEPGDSQ